jgi:hypothetical protein
MPADGANTNRPVHTVLGVFNVNNEAATAHLCVIEFVLVAFHIFATMCFHYQSNRKLLLSFDSPFEDNA